MRYNPRIERELLELLERDQTGEGVGFSRHDEVRRSGFAEQSKKLFLAMPDMSPEKEFHLKLLADQGLAEYLRDWSSNDNMRFQITFLGHQKLDEFRNNIWWKRVLRWLGRTLDKALSSIILPIVVTILTTILLKFFNL